jgi:hypothetical protein
MITVPFGGVAVSPDKIPDELVNGKRLSESLRVVRQRNDYGKRYVWTRLAETLHLTVVGAKHRTISSERDAKVST